MLVYEKIKCGNEKIYVRNDVRNEVSQEQNNIVIGGNGVHARYNGTKSESIIFFAIFCMCPNGRNNLFYSKNWRSTETS